MDKIFIKDLEIFANHGYFQEEKNLGQKFVLTMEVELDLSKASSEDNLEDTVHYGILCDEIEKEFTKTSYDLIETACEELINSIMLKYNTINKISLELKKPWAPVKKHLDYVSIKMERSWHEAIIAVGANIGDKKKNIMDAFEIIDNSKHTKIVEIANFYETEPFGYEDQDMFLNTAIKIKTMLRPKRLMEYLLEVEKDLKRERIIRWGPRTLDLDIIFYEDLISYEKDIILPHPRMEERLFVLDPLCDIVPYKVHPILNKRVIDIKKELENK
ncbi:2-amino-4-hydroxy-6-hydroxymethyldihydropteridine diphosphokinase [Clostridium senegalense]|uniref:Bifunctional folate synthesis protein n=1 Tax=Clostridium senegalense TaxID=1465809 RepID=A0A6M0H5Q5_9CLOT|nr:2-amino-4-hydroxy-6-hydroxymethyldihydropteridine diphosphokinase [Clostridium senegalense]NEU04932.1 2-amino-4-hydroxy-6-hydroxymethyldihydropteridine diphosphokinase [Clostridium senegalense]